MATESEQAHAALLLLKGAISEMPPADQAKVHQLAEGLRWQFAAMHAAHGDAADVTIALVTLERAAEPVAA